MEFIINLDSPYILSKGWTDTEERFEELKDCFKEINLALNLESSTNEYDILEGSNKGGQILSSYMHPSQLVFNVQNKEVKDEIVRIVNEKLYNLLSYYVKIKNTK